jgi:hypothetical protein
VSLSTDPTFSLLKSQFVCGYEDIENKGFAGASGRHECDGNAVNTSNGAGPRNVQIFVLAPDGTVLHCLPGYWHSRDLAQELVFAQKLNRLWLRSDFSLAQKKTIASQLQLAHIGDHSQAEHDRSHMQPFDVSYESSHNPGSDALLPGGQAKTIDVLMHERMAVRPFVPYDQFDVKTFSAYGDPMYDKHENSLASSGGWHGKEEFIGNDKRAHPIKAEIMNQLGLGRLKF